MGSLPQDAQDASGLLYRRNRFYDPKSGRFTQEDPIGLAGGVNSYGFAEGDPVSYGDPYGLLCEPWPACAVTYWIDAATNADAEGKKVKAAGASVMWALASIGYEVLYVPDGVLLAGIPGEVPPVGAAAEARGGTYLLRDAESGQVMRTGRTNHLPRRQAEHARDPATRDLEFELDRRTDSYPAQRGREQIIHDQHNPPANKIRPISPRNPRREEYMKAGREQR